MSSHGEGRETFLRLTWPVVFRSVLRVAITCLFAPAILAKLRHPDEWATLFRTWGYPSWGAIAVSLAETVSLFLLWIRPLAIPAISILATTLTGAVVTWMIHGPRATAAYPAAILLLIAGLVWLEILARRDGPRP